MQPSLVKSYFDFIKKLITNNPLVLQSTVKRERIGSSEGFIQISANLIKGCLFDVFEYYGITDGVSSYRYNLINAKNELIARWDNAPHHPEIATHPHHVHLRNGLGEFSNPSLTHVLSLLPDLV
jgi:hypothetical protein